MARTGYVKLHRSFLEWEWYDDDRCVRLMLHLMLIVNHAPTRWRGVDVAPGQVITSTIALAEQLGWSRSAVVRTLDKLKTSGEVDTKPDNKRTLVTLGNWAKYQYLDEEPDNKPDNNRTSNGHQTDTNKNDNNVRMKEGKKSESARATSITSLPFEAFREACLTVHREHKILPDAEAKAFFEYWTEGHPAVKPRYARQQVFDIAKRMRTWKRNNDGRPSAALADQPQPSGIKSYKL